MNNDLLHRDAVAAVAGAAAWLVSSLLEPQFGDDPDQAIRIVAGNDRGSSHLLTEE